MGKQLKKVQVTFNSELIKDIFNKLPAVLRVSELNHHYTLITSDVNSLITQLVPYLSAIDNLEIRQQTNEINFPFSINGIEPLGCKAKQDLMFIEGTHFVLTIQLDKSQ